MSKIREYQLNAIILILFQIVVKFFFKIALASDELPLAALFLGVEVSMTIVAVINAIKAAKLIKAEK